MLCKFCLFSMLLVSSLAFCQETVFQATPLTDYSSTQLYKGLWPGFLYEGSNSVPAAHDSDGQALASQIQPRDINGKVSPTGKIVLLSIGMSNATDEWCSPPATEPCTSPSFMSRAARDPQVNHVSLVIKDGAYQSMDAKHWVCATGNCPPGSGVPNNYDRVKNTVLAPAGLSEKQVQAVWLKEADMLPKNSLPAQNSDAYILERYLGATLRAIRKRYPNCKLVFLSSRIYAGYATTPESPEPYAYENGFSVKWTIQAQIKQMINGHVNQVTGDLNYETGVAPWVGWGPYLWASGNHPRSDGLTWTTDDYDQDGTHPNNHGVTKVANLMMKFFMNSPYTQWFVAPFPGSEGTKNTQPENKTVAQR
jgi:hypothetical protein